MEFDVGDIVIAKKSAGHIFVTSTYANHFVGKIFDDWIGKEKKVLVLKNDEKSVVGRIFRLEMPYFLNLTKILPKIMRDENAGKRN